MAKTTGKKPSAPSKSARPAASSRPSDRKPPGVSAKTSAKNSKPPVKKPGERVASKSVAAVRAVEKHKPEPVQKLKKDGPKAESSKLDHRKLDDRKLDQRKLDQRKLDRSPKKADSGSAEVTKPVQAAEVVAPTPIAPVTQIPANGKPRKNQAGFSVRELDHFRDLLLAKRRELIGDMGAMEREALRVGGGSNLSNLPIHMADMGTDNYEQEFTLGLVQKERDLLKEINTALAKIQNGVYGLCEGTGLPILKERLEYQPWARYSVEHQRKLERHGR